VPDGDVEDLLDDAVDLDAVASYDVDLLTDTSWSPGMGEAELAPDCAECGNTVTAEGETTRLDGELYHFCCASCESQFVEQYENLRQGIDS
jgi:YHS domain-containing protein